ncbi:phosphate/phosphite/phosphonate ABC transporter substrate-binding protein [Iningainema tapete]|uniref:Phosphate/phosphite/phosphonate ABC transporter substrate-binding protein n=1 Tax=Iningainema tapete BLCC-T55 TaxID=2748662 RepID=A0A8J6XCY7_9CYAN|nr:phosphate/phosphite/phosphonate ABC transporter substrate-binding protein [Iningainema tapete]MBD2772794.1 phosphate/phosphite/phosphonate ABC transporter substrate-binding protein [Iningainema tapete BLCC-T55]
MILPRFLLKLFLVLLAVFFLSGCDAKEIQEREKLTIGVVSYGEETISLQKYERFKDYIAARTQSIVELEPAYNELQAIEQIQRQRWDIVFAPPGLAAIAIADSLYVPLYAMESISSRQRSLIIVRDEQPIKKMNDLANKKVALGEMGSAAGYYVPLYDLYGLTLAQIRFAPTPKAVLQLVSEGSVDAGALSELDFERYYREFNTTKFRILQTSRWIPAGLVLLGPNIERNRQQQIQIAMNEAPGDIIADAGYVPTASIPKYEQFVKLVQKVKPLEKRVRQTPVVLLPVNK